MRRVGYHFGMQIQPANNASRASARSPAERNSWEDVYNYGAVYAVQGRRPRMEDRLVHLNTILIILHCLF